MKRRFSFGGSAGGNSTYPGCALLALSLFTVSQASAQQPAGRIEEILVTATKRVESIQDVPVSVSSVDSELLKKTGMSDLADISMYIPNFEFSSTGILPNLYVRGIGTGTSHSVEQSVGRFIDEVYIGRGAINMHPLFDVAGVEVLRGPQGTLFGKNTLAGAVIINTAEPTRDFDAGFTLSAGDYSTVGGTVGAEGFLSGPLSSSLSARLAVLYRDKEGYLENLSPGPDGASQQDFNARVKLRWEPTDYTTADLKLEHMQFEYDGQTMIETVGGVFPGGPAAGQPLPASVFQAFAPEFTFERDWRISLSCEAEIAGTTFCPGRDQDTTNVTLEINHDIGELGTVTSVSGYQAYDFDFRFATVDGGVAGGASRFSPTEDYEGLTQELRLTSERFDSFDYILGVYYETSEIDRRVRDDQNIPAFLTSFPPQALPPPRALQEDWFQETETMAVFGQLRYWLTDRWSTVLGARWASEDKDFDFTTQTVGFNQPFDPAVGPSVSLSRSESRATPSATLRYEPNDALMFFGTVAQGHKSGGFSDRPQPDPEFDEEVNTSFELGMKASWLSGALRVNLALFRMNIDDLQVSRSIVGAVNTFEVQNAAEAVSQGLEFDALWFPGDNWSVGANFAYTDAEYDDFPGAAPQCPGLGGSIGADGLCNFAGLPLIFAPEFKGGAFVELNLEDAIGSWGVSARADVNYSSEFYPELTYNEGLKQDDYTMLHASVSLRSPEDKVAVSMIGRNLTDEHVIAWGLTGGFVDFVAPRAPRELILQVTYRY